MTIIAKIKVPFLTNDARLGAVLERNIAADGQFFFGVKTTGIFCKPSCGARNPKPENVTFFDDTAAAERAGFRACKRCKPKQIEEGDEKQDMVVRACRFIDEVEFSPKLDDIAAHVGVSRFHFHRVFKEIMGITPKAYSANKRRQKVKKGLQQTKRITDAIFDAGYENNSRFYENSAAFLGMTPKEFKAGGRGKNVIYTITTCPLGLMLLAATEQGICSIEFGDEKQVLEQKLKQNFPHAHLANKNPEFDNWVKQALKLIGNKQGQESILPLDIQGTAFQQKVWKTLLSIPFGVRVSYQQVAQQMTMPKATRAVANAIAKNPVAVAIPCHRVVRGDGALSGYRWGSERKSKLLAMESKK